MIIDKLPVWAIRDYDRLWEDEQGFKILQTHRTRYTLDCVHVEGNYWDRRLRMLDMALPYKLYPIKKRFEYVDQLLTHKNRKFIDSEGKIIIYKPTRFVELKTDPIIARWEARNGDMMFKVQNCPRTFRTKYPTNDQFLTYFKDGNKFYMYALVNSKLPSTRKKI